tara:strand:+ start:276 stop:440 length:165 start_codon:yes stop_codon:yes gene_type:complete
LNDLFADYVDTLEAVFEAAVNLRDAPHVEQYQQELAAAVAECEEARRAESAQYD